MTRRIEPLSRHRRILLPVVLWTALAATVGLAAVVRVVLDRSVGIELGPPQTVGSLELRLPAGWVTEISSFPGGVWIVANAESDGRPREQLDIFHLSNPAGLSPEELMVLKPPIGIPLAYFERQHPALPVPIRATGQLSHRERWIPVAGAEGLMREGFRLTQDQSWVWRDLFATAQLPADEAIVVKLRTLRSPDDLQDRRDPLLMRRIAESIVVRARVDVPPAAPESIEADPEEFEEPVRE